MILLEMVIQVAVRPMRHPIPKDVPNGARVCIAAIRGDAVQGHAGHRLGRTKERFGRREVPHVAEAYVHEVAISINRPVEVSPLALDTYVGFVHVPAGSDLAATPLPQRLAEERSQLALPLPHRFMRKAEAPLEKHFRQVSQAQFVPEAPQDDQTDLVGWIL
jgi:hypothetical protein